MKRVVALAVLLLSMLSARGASKKLTVDQLREKLVSLQLLKKSDREVATQLKDVELTEELTQNSAESLAKLLPGQESVVEIEMLEGRTAVLSPPASDIPNDPAPDVAVQRAMLGKTVSYVMKTYMQSPRLLGAKTTTRYQDGVEYIRTNSGVVAGSADNNPGWHRPSPYMQMLGSHTATVESENGIEKPLAAKNKTPWSQNGQTSEGGPGPILSVILQDAAAGGKLQWLRWELIDGKKVAVYSFAVDAKKSHYSVDYCCFPVSSQAGALYYVPTANMQTGVDWKAFKATVGYRGRFSVDPETGEVMRLVTQADLKTTDPVHQEDMRIDYAPVDLGGTSRLLPVKTYTITEVAPNGDDSGASYSVRHTLFRAEYKDYRLAEERSSAVQ